MKKRIILYASYVPEFGGVEKFMETWLKLMDSRKYDVLFLYGSAQVQAVMLQYAVNSDIELFQESKQYQCDTLVLSSNHVIPRNIKYSKIVQIIHSDYSKYKEPLKNVGVVNQFIAVSKHAGKIAEQMFNIKPKVIYNLVDPKFGTEKRPLRLVTNSRISPEKGFSRMLKMVTDMKAQGIPFRWYIYGVNTYDICYMQEVIQSFKLFDEVYFMGFRLDVTDGLRIADYLVQLSDFEGCPYAVLEALQMKVPVILTDFPSAYEMIRDGVDGYILPSEMEGIDYKVIAEKIPVIKNRTLSSIQEWENVL